MVETDISKADKSRKIVAYIKCRDMKNPEVCILKWSEQFHNWRDSQLNFFCDSVIAWEYVFEPPVEKSELSKRLMKFQQNCYSSNKVITNLKCLEDLVVLMVKKLEELL